MIINKYSYKIKKCILKYLEVVKYYFGSEKIININAKFILIISHTDYLNSIGGTEKYIYEQSSKVIHEDGLSVLQIFPCDRNGFLSEKKTLYGINLNNNFLGYYNINKILVILDNNKKYLEKTYIHHLIYWQYCDIKLILNEMINNKKKIIYFMHDFYACSPSVYKIYTSQNIDEKNIYSVDDKFNIVDTLSDIEEINSWREVFKEILYNVDKIVVPSNFVKKVVEHIYIELSEKIIVVGHLRLTNKLLKQVIKRNKIRIAYFGYKAYFKGWNAWEKIYTNKRIESKYEFYHIGNNERYSKNVKSVSYSFKDDGIMSAVNVLKSNKIDIVVLWSLLPESYSYTMYEAIAAGVPIITNNKSGNICETILENKTLGVVLNNEDELVKFLEDKNKCNQLLSQRRNIYELKFNSEL